MAYISQEEKKAIAPKVKAILAQYGLKGTLSVDNRSTLVLTLKSGVIDFGTDNGSVNHHWINSHFHGVAAECLNKLCDALRGEGWYDNSDVQIDYFNIKHYIDIKIGRWNNKYVLTK
jgi:hypothetical protein